MLLLLSCLPSLQAAAQLSGSFPFQSLAQYKTALNFTPYYSATPSARPVKVAVLDKGFLGYEAEIGKSLPQNTRYVPGPVTPPAELKVEHGLRMAQILVSLMTNEGKNPSLAPDLTLYNVFGYSNFKAAITDAIDQKVDVILYSEVWEYGGNNDGRGFLNVEVSRATNAGILWINAAGNFETRTWNGGITTVADDWVKLPDPNDSLVVRCAPDVNYRKTCELRAVLSWNDFKDDVEAGTSKDLDLALTDDMLEILETAALKQSNDPNEGRAGYSKYPREILTAELQPGKYLLRVKNRSKNFSLSDKIRLVVSGDFITLTSPTAGESLLNPADHPRVVAVGATDSVFSSMSRRLGRPDVMSPSAIKMNNEKKDEFRGTSNAAAVVAAGAALMKSIKPALTREQLLALAVKAGGSNSAPPSSGGGAGLTLAQLGFRPTKNGCFASTDSNWLPKYAMNVVDRGGTLVQTTGGLKLLVPFDPVTLGNNLRRQATNDAVTVGPDGLRVIRRSQVATLPTHSFEVFQTPQEAGLCIEGVGAVANKRFLLPPPHLLR
jgi:subtilisin family serine protease